MSKLEQARNDAWEKLKATPEYEIHFAAYDAWYGTWADDALETWKAAREVLEATQEWKDWRAAHVHYRDAEF
jgi:hypothetical protein